MSATLLMFGLAGLLLGGMAVLSSGVSTPGAAAQSVPRCGGEPVTLLGTAGNDVLRGTPGRDVIHGLGGRDRISGLGGDDILCGGTGRDVLRGGGGNDQLFGGSGRDQLRPGAGTDELNGGRGNDRCRPNGRDWAIFCELASLERGINFAGDFEVEPRGAWGQPISIDAFRRVARAGFDHVRVPIRWSSHTGPAPAYRIDENFAVEVDALIVEAARFGLTIIVDVHHFEELDDDPVGERAHFLSIWTQLAERYADQPDTVVFELLNEPVGVFADEPEVWNELLAASLEIVRATNPDRTVIVGPVNWNHPSRLDQLELPDDDNLVVTVHSYDPSWFTVQGASFVDPVPPTGLRWSPGQVGVDYAWNGFHWDGELTATAGGLDVRYDSQSSAIAFERFDDFATPFTDHDTLFFETSEPFEDAVVLCRPVGTADYVSAGVVTGEVSAGGVFEASARIPTRCGGTSSVAIQINGAARTVTFFGVGLCGPSGCEELVVTGRQSIDAMFERAASWAEANGVELHLGEFGVYDAPGDPVHRGSRNAWIRTMRTLAENHEIGWAYFEMNGEFGISNQDRWRTPMLRALIDD